MSKWILIQIFLNPMFFSLFSNMYNCFFIIFFKENKGLDNASLYQSNNRINEWINNSKCYGKLKIYPFLTTCSLNDIINNSLGESVCNSFNWISGNELDIFLIGFARKKWFYLSRYCFFLMHHIKFLGWSTFGINTFCVGDH